MKMENMLKYQEIDGKIKKIIYGLNHSDESLRGKKLGQFLKESEEQLKKMDRRAEELTSLVNKLKTTYQQSIKDFDELENGVGNAIDKDELNYLSKKLTDVSRSIATIEKDVNAAIKEMDDISKRYDELRGKVPTARSQYMECKEKFEALKKQREPEVSALRAELQTVEKEVDAKTLEIYQKLRKQGIYPVLVPLVGANKCGGCQMEVSIGATGKLDENSFVVCENCQRLIYKK